MSAGCGPRERAHVTPEELRATVRQYRAEQPALGLALRRDAIRFAAMRGEPYDFPSRRAQWTNAARMLFAADDFAGVALYRLRMALHRRGIPVLPWLLNRACILFFGIRIGDRALIREGVYVPHGNIVIDGVVSIGGGCTLCPWTTIGLKQGSFVGPIIEGNVFIGTGAKVLGEIHIGANANIGAGAVVVTDIPADSNASGVPARAHPRPAAD